MTRTDEIRDDNLRLLFAEAAKQDLLERQQAIQTGFTILSIAVLVAISAWVMRLVWSEPVSGTHILETLILFDTPLNFAISTFLLLSGGIALLSPIVLGILIVERRRCHHDMRDLISLLNKYGRL